jgi:molybdate/tungstate transport system ATP-binding protein
MIQIDQLTVDVGGFALRDVSMTVPAGQYAVLMGRTGSGKSTLLESICGLRRIAAGRVILAGVDVTRLRPALRGVGYVPQDGALFSRMTVREHLGFALEIRRASRAAISVRIDELSLLLGIESLLDRTPGTLSGGERQRVAIGRAIAVRPHTLLLDEPLSAVDEETRESAHELLKSVQRHTGVTVLHVTHNRQEAERLADCLFRLDSQGISPQPLPARLPLPQPQR